MNDSLELWILASTVKSIFNCKSLSSSFDIYEFALRNFSLAHETKSISFINRQLNDPTIESVTLNDSDLWSWYDTHENKVLLSLDDRRARDRFAIEGAQNQIVRHWVCCLFSRFAVLSINNVQTQRRQVKRLDSQQAERCWLCSWSWREVSGCDDDGGGIIIDADLLLPTIYKFPPKQWHNWRLSAHSSNTVLLSRAQSSSATARAISSLNVLLKANYFLIPNHEPWLNNKRRKEKRCDAFSHQFISAMPCIAMCCDVMFRVRSQAHQVGKIFYVDSSSSPSIGVSQLMLRYFSQVQVRLNTSNLVCHHLFSTAL